METIQESIAKYIAEYQDKLNPESLAEGINTHILGNKIIINTEEIDHHCYNCGEKIEMDPRRPFIVAIEPYQNNYPHEPDIPEEIYLICFDCIGGFMLDYYPGSDE